MNLVFILIKETIWKIYINLHCREFNDDITKKLRTCLHIHDYIITAIYSTADINFSRDQEVASYNRRDCFLGHGGRNYQEIHCTDIDCHNT